MIFKNEETRIQVALSNYIKYKYPQALFTIAPSGMKLPIHVAKMLKAMGYRPGTPDIMIFEPKGIYIGLFLELKTLIGRPSPEQNEMIAGLNKRGYLAVIGRGYNMSIKIVDDYFQLKPWEGMANGEKKS